MGSEWQEEPLELLVEEIFDRRGVTPKKLGSDFIESGHRVLSAKLMKGGRLDFGAADARFVDSETYKKWMKSPLYADDVLLTSEAPLGEVAYMTQPKKWCLGQRLFGIRTKKEKLNGRFLYYVLQTGDTRSDLLNRASGTTVQGIRQVELRKVLVKYPSLQEQKAIAHILGSLDDKIELNRQTNQTLEAMAQALFKSWFVDFDPVIDNALAAGNPIPEALQARAQQRADQQQKAAANGQQANPSGDFHQHFPDEFTCTDQLGWIPKGWEICNFEQMVEAKQGKYLAKTEMTDNLEGDFQFPVWGGNGVLGFASKSSYDTPVTLMTCRGSNCGLIRTTESESWVSNNSFACRPKFGSDYFLYVYFLNESFEGCVSGSAQPQITYTALRSKTMKFPLDKKVCDRFSTLTKTFRNQSFSNNAQIEALAKLRDTLLPKLISGELRIPDAEKLVAEAGL